MNWFGATGFVTVAKSTLKGAQKAIDKALDIKEEEDNADKISTPVPAPTKDDSDSFFATWGVKSEGSPEKTASTSASQDSVFPDLWGSFTGSFFENPQPLASSGDEGTLSPISEQPKRSAVSNLLAAHGDADTDSELALGDDRAVWEGFSKTQLVVESLASVKDDKQGSFSLNTTVPSDDVKFRRTEKHSDRTLNKNNYGNNRLSVVSSESDRRSSESVEVLGSASCTASPDSDLPTSLSASSLASSAGLRPVSVSSPDSVEIIPESSDSHCSSVEVLGSRSSSASLSSPGDPLQERFILLSSNKLASPDSVEVVPEEEDDASFADDSYASASASESTMTQATVLEPHGQINSAMESSAHFIEPLDSIGPADFIASSTSGRTDSSVSSLILDSSTDTIHSDHGSLGRSGMQLTLTTEYPQPSKSSWTSSSQQSLSDRSSPAMKSYDSSLENISTKVPASPKKSFTKPKELSGRVGDTKEWKSHETKFSSGDSFVEDTLATLTPNDSSGEGTLMESSSEDTIPGADSQSQQSTSGYVRSLLAEAMVDDPSQMRVNSPVSMESRSDLGLRLGSEQTSGHTSGDELETTTSSDIEIISSPNGDGSSTTSRQSPAKHLQRISHGPVDLLKFSGKIKAHIRGLEFGVASILRWLVIFLGLMSSCDACSARIPSRLRPPPSTPRPNITDDSTFDCPPAWAEWFCLNGATCFEVRLPENMKMYSCFCADGYWGSRCEYKGLDGTYGKYLIETAGIAGGVAIAIFLSVVVCACLHVHLKRKRQRRSTEWDNIPIERRPFDKRTTPRDRPESIRLTSLA